MSNILCFFLLLVTYFDPTFKTNYHLRLKKHDLCVTLIIRTIPPTKSFTTQQIKKLTINQIKSNCLQSSKSNKQQPHRNKEKICIIEKFLLFMFQHLDYETHENIDKH
jgi:hypothetical protein